MNVQIIRVSAARRRHRPNGKGSTLDKAFARGTVDGYSVVCTVRKGWLCSCDDDGCGHADAFAAVLHPKILAELEGGDE